MEMSRSPGSYTFKAGAGVDLYYEVAGKHDAKRQLLFLHGFAASTENWSDVRRPFERDYCLLSLDLKGNGRSSRPRDGDYSLDTQADLLGRFIAECCQKDLVIVGHSYGGAVTLLTLVKAQEQGHRIPISGMVLVDVPAYPQPLPIFVAALNVPVLGSLVPLKRNKSCYIPSGRG
jgi:pimeloyl-ACP methyl ester carboxylesterase